MLGHESVLDPGRGKRPEKGVRAPLHGHTPTRAHSSTVPPDVAQGLCLGFQLALRGGFPTSKPNPRVDCNCTTGILHGMAPVRANPEEPTAVGLETPCNAGAAQEDSEASSFAMLPFRSGHWDQVPDSLRSSRLPQAWKPDADEKESKTKQKYTFSNGNRSGQ